MKICGIDEAGRGPVIGPLVTAGIITDEEGEKKLRALGVKDSKLIAPAVRERMYQEIIQIVDKYHIISLSPQDIDSALLDPSTNLNWLEADTSAQIINELKPEKAILDCPSNNIKDYTDYVIRKLNVDCTVVAEHKADLNHITVSAASILAKVTRDKKIAEIRKKVDADFGSGYPADPKTKAFIQTNYQKYPEIFRKTWQTYKDVVNKKEQKGLGDF